MGEILTGKIVDIGERGVSIHTDIPAHVIKRQYEEVLVEFVDARPISGDQRRKAWAIMTDIADWCGDDKDSVYTVFKHNFTLKQVDTLKRELFRLSQANMTEAREFLNYLISFCLDYDVPMSAPLYLNTDDIDYYMRECLLHKRCAVCGKPAQLHHVDRVGSHGGSREKISHIGLRAEPLCGLHHRECHDVGQAQFDAQYHFHGVPIDQEIATKYKLNTKPRKETA